MSSNKISPLSGQDLGRELSTRVVMFHQAVAEHFDLNATEHKCLDLLRSSGPITAGQLSEVIGLTTGATTKIVDRLEKNGFVLRERSKTDRRQVIIHLIPQQQNEIEQIFASLSKEMFKVAEGYSVEELEVIQDYLIKIIEVLKHETKKLKKN